MNIYWIIAIIITSLLLLSIGGWALWYYWLSLMPKFWKDCSKASCWDGSNAQTRMMNILSPHMSETEFKARVKWTLKRGCNCLHLFVCNKADGEYAGYSIYGGGDVTPLSRSPNSGIVSMMTKRITYARRQGLGIVLWLMADDSSAWNRALLANPAQYAYDLKKTGLLSYASTVVLGLEINEYASALSVRSLSYYISKVYGGKIGVHHTSSSTAFANYGDILFYQTNPGLNAAQIKAAAAKALATGKPVNYFELARNPQRELSQAALAAGCFGVGNW
jgi:hypothetical protein